MVSVDMKTLTAGLIQHSDEIIKLLKKIEDLKLRREKVGAVVCYVIDKTIDANVDILGILESAKMALLSDTIMKVAIDKMIEEATTTEK